MIRQADLIYKNCRKQQLKNQILPGANQENTTSNTDENPDGNSGVGQALEFPSGSLTKASSPKTSRWIAKIGTLLIIFSILGFGFSYGEIIKIEIGYRISRLLPPPPNPKGSFADIVNKQFFGEIEGVPDPNFSLIIPKIHAKGKVIPDVDTNDYSVYMTALAEGVAHAKGSHYPGEKGNIFLFAHSTDNPDNVIRYNAIFYLLRELEKGDEVELYYQNVKYRYSVIDKKIVEPTDVSYLTADNPEGEEQVIMQTCWPPGTRLKRLLVFARKITTSDLRLINSN